MLEVRRLSKNFGGVQALTDISFSLAKEEFLGLIGPNGSGKTTLFNVLSGAYRPSSGEVTFEGRNITGLTPDKICHAGIARTFQIPKPVKSMNVVDNVMIGLLFGGSERPASCSEDSLRDDAVGLLDFVGLKIDGHMEPDKLTAGDLRKLELARALATKPKLLLADEILSGLNREEIEEATDVLKRVRDEMGITIIWVEHIMAALMSLVDRTIVLNYGVVIADGTPEEVSKNKGVVEAYLGEEQE